MKRATIKLMLSTLLMAGLILMSGPSYSQIGPGQRAPEFSLQSLDGNSYRLSQMINTSLLILYFFDVDSRPSQEGLINLNAIARDYKEIDMEVWAVTLSPRQKVAAFIERSGLEFPVLIDTAHVSDSYNARLILPSVCIIGPGLKILDYFQGGGKTTEMMLLRLAERELQRSRTAAARAISREVLAGNPDNIEAVAVQGYSEIKDNNFESAANIFADLAREGRDAEVLAKEGMIVIHAMKNQIGKALEIIKDLEIHAPERSYAHVVKGNILYQQNRWNEAEQEYLTATRSNNAALYHQAAGYNQLGRYYAEVGRYDEARKLYEQAEIIDPYRIESTTNKGLAYEKEGQWDKALESYRQALSIDKDDAFAAVLARKAQYMLDLERDSERRERMDRLIKDLAERYREQKKDQEEIKDAWTSRPMVLSFIDIGEKGGLPERDGFSQVLMAQLAEHLNSSGRIRVVDRSLIERLLEELNIGSSDLADGETGLRLGHVLAAKLIATGSLYYLPQRTLLNLKLIDTETSEIPHTLIEHIEADSDLEKKLFQLNRDILRTVMTKYPLRGYIVKRAGDQFMINLGSRQGVLPGTTFDVIADRESVAYRGKILQAAPEAVARVEAVEVEPDLCYVRVLRQSRPLKTNDKIEERVGKAVL